MQGSGRLELGKQKITWCWSYIKVLEVFGQALPLFAFLVFMHSWAQLHDCCLGHDCTATRKSLQPDNQLSVPASFYCLFERELKHLWRFNRNLNTCDWNWLSVSIYTSKSLLLTSSWKSNASLVWSFFKGVNICWKFFAVLILLCLLSRRPDGVGETPGVHQSS